MIVWDSKYLEPQLASSGAAPTMRRHAAPDPEMASFKPGCKPKITARTHVGKTAPAGTLAMWEMVAINAAVQASGGSAAGGFSTLIERGNVHPLGASDAGLFQIPAGFTKEVPSPMPS
jgi:hypothetical protein